jgi:hypothetical protein
MTTTVKWVSTGIWALLSLLAIALVGYFVTSQPEVPPAKGFLALPSVDSVAKATEEIGQIKWDLTQFRQAVDQLKDLEKTANPKEFDEFKQQIAVIATSINQAANQDEGRWKEISEKAGKVAAESKKLGEEAEAVRNTLKSLQTEGTQWKASLISNLLWFLLLSALLVTLFVSPNLTGMMQFVVRFVRGVKVPGFELSFTEDSGQKNRDIHLWFSEAFDELRGQAKKALRLFAEQQDIDQVFRSTVNRILAEVRSRQNTTLPVVQGAAPPTAGNAAVDGVRSTLHVRDVVFKDYLCQLLDYYPRRPAGGRAGRAWPVCYGMIGRVWRSEKSELRSLGAPSHGTSINQTLIDEYAMTEEQVRELVGNGRSFLCLLLRDTNRNLLGVLYMDAPGEKVFGEYPDPANPHSAVREGIAGSNFDSLLVHCAELVKKLSVYSDKVYGKAPLIEVMETHES